MNSHLTLALAAMLAFPVSALAKQPIPTNSPAARFQPDDVCSGRVGGGNRSHNGCSILAVLTKQHGAGVRIEVAFDGSERRDLERLALRQPLRVGHAVAEEIGDEDRF